ncbi:MAG: ACP S-malonyltransferase [Candidatus Omnitrophica bacterium]|nr:ACP S-malonyltransferase [Candidatus Omnitrophota bacterium]
MVESAFIFPGQGAQYVGMGKELYDNHEIARRTFEQANEILGFDLKRLCFEGPEKELTMTRNCQAAILVSSIAALRVHLLSSCDYVPQVTLGLSLGEYSALVCAEAICFSDAVKLVRSRGLFMEEASNDNPGKMACIIGLDLEQVEDICRHSKAQVANLNCPGQIVISGSIESIDSASVLAKEKGAKRVIVLDVSGPFHSALMAQACHKLDKVLKDMQFMPPKIPVISNVTAFAQDNPDMIKANLVDQISLTTRWEDSIRKVASRGIKHFFEIGPGTVLKGLLRRIDPGLVCHNVPA